MPSIKLARSIVGLLILQFLLGVLASMYQEVPEGHPEEVFRQFGYISVHIVNGTLLLVLGAIFLYQAVKRKAYKAEAIRGFVAIIAAYAFGETFVFTQNDIWSFFMAGAFIGALMPYVTVVNAARPKEK